MSTRAVSAASAPAQARLRIRERVGGMASAPPLISPAPPPGRTNTVSFPDHMPIPAPQTRRTQTGDTWGEYGQDSERAKGTCILIHDAVYHPCSRITPDLL